jgi:hypothetical protein
VFEAKQTALEEYLKLNFAGVELVYENMKSPAPELFDEWARIVVMFGDSKRMQIGGRGYRHPGLLIVQVFIREGIGINRGVELADTVRGLLMDQVIAGVNLQVPSVIKVPVADAGWHQLQVVTPFYFDEVI